MRLLATFLIHATLSSAGKLVGTWRAPLVAYTICGESTSREKGVASFAAAEDDIGGL